jgi:RHS repeat-associated protein
MFGRGVDTTAHTWVTGGLLMSTGQLRGVIASFMVVLILVATATLARGEDDPTELTLGKAHSGTLSGSSDSTLFSVTPGSGVHLIVLVEKSSGWSSRLEVRAGAAPTSTTYDTADGGSGDRSDQQVEVVSTTSAKYYIRIRAQSPDGGGSYSLTALAAKDLPELTMGGDSLSGKFTHIRSEPIYYIAPGSGKHLLVLFERQSEFWSSFTLHAGTLKSASITSDGGNGDSSDQQLELTSTASGPYFVRFVVRDSGPYKWIFRTGSFKIRALEAKDLPNLSLGAAATSGSFAYRWSERFYRVAPGSGKHLLVLFERDSEFWSSATLHSGTLKSPSLASDGGNGDSSDQQLELTNTASGSYFVRLAVRDSGPNTWIYRTGSFKLRALEAMNLPTLSLGAGATSGSFAHRWSEPIYRVEPGSGKHLLVLFERDSEFWSSATLHAGTLKSSTLSGDGGNGDSSDQQLELTSTTSGSYFVRLAVRDSGPYTWIYRTGSFKIRALEAKDLPTLTLGAAATPGSFAHRWSEPIYRIEPGSGKHLLVLFERDSEFWSSITLHPGTLKSASIAGDGGNGDSSDKQLEAPSTVSGSYFVRFALRDSGPYKWIFRTGSFGIRALEAKDLPQLTLGSPVTARFEYAGAERFFRVQSGTLYRLLIALRIAHPKSARIDLRMGRIPTPSEWDASETSSSALLGYDEVDEDTEIFLRVTSSHVGSEYTLEATGHDLTILSLDDPVSMTTEPGLLQYFRLTIAGDQEALVELDILDSAGEGRVYLYGDRGRLPSRTSHLYRDEDRPGGLKQKMSLPDRPVTSVYYILVQDLDEFGGPVSYTLLASTPGFQILGASPDSGPQGGVVTLRATGLGFTDDTTVGLRSGSGATIHAVSSQRAGSTELFATFDLAGAALGDHDVVVSNPGGVSRRIEDAFEVVGPSADAGTGFWVSLTVPEAVRPDRYYSLMVEYGNAGSVDVPAPILRITTSPSMSLRLDPVDNGRVGPLHLLAVSGKGPADRLRPGTSFRIPVYFRAPRGQELRYTVARLEETEDKIDWKKAAKELDPSDEGEQACWENFVEQIGKTWADSANTLRSDAAFLARHGSLGQVEVQKEGVSFRDLADPSVYDVRRLLEFEVARAEGTLAARRIQAGSLDASFPTPGLPLSFHRVAFLSIWRRSRLGPMGRGWSHMYEFTASQSADGSVVIAGPGGEARIFRDNGGGYRSQTGDHGRLMQVSEKFELTENDGLVRTFGTDGSLESIVDRRGTKLTMIYVSGLLTEIRHSSGSRLALMYDPDGRLTTVRDPAGRSTVYRYDSAGEHLLEVEEPGGRTTSYSYHADDGSPASHALTMIEYPDGVRRSFRYDVRGRLSEEFLGDLEQVLRHDYPERGAVRVRDATGASALYRLGTRHELLSMELPDGEEIEVSRDADLNLSRLSGPGTDLWRAAWSDRGRPLEIIDALENRVRFTVDPDTGDLNHLRDELSNETRFVVGSKGTMTEIEYPDLGKDRFSYDDVGGLTEFASRRGHSIQYEYDLNGQLTKKLHPDGREFTYTYDGKGNLVTASDSLTGDLDFQWDDRDFVVRIDYPGGQWVAFEYDDAGRRTKMSCHDGYVLSYGFDEAGRLATLSDGAANKLAQYEYDGRGLLATVVRGNGTSTAYSYDSSSRVVKLTDRDPNGGLRSEVDYTRDETGRITSVETEHGTSEYEYDVRGQLVSATDPDGIETRFVYDAAGNRKSVTREGVTTTYLVNGMNQYTQVGSAILTHDAGGNRTGFSDTTYGYDAEGRLVSVASPTLDWSCEYDALGNRSFVTAGGTRSTYLWNPIGLPYQTASYDDSGTLLDRWTYGVGLVGRISAGGSLDYYHVDATSHTGTVSDSWGAVTHSIRYSPFGGVTTSPEMDLPAALFAGDHGVLFDPTGLHFMRNRYHDPVTGRFVTEDPIGIRGGINLHRYAENDPVNGADPDGLQALRPTSGEFHARVRKRWQASGENGIRSLTPLHPVSVISGGETRLDVIDADEVRAVPDGGPWVWFYFYGLKIVHAFFNLVNFQAFDVCIGMPFKYEDLKKSEIIAPVDPNEKTGPLGFGDPLTERFITPGSKIVYVVDFENLPTATASAQEVIITDSLSTDLDWSTFRLGEVVFGDRVLTSFTGEATGSETVVMDGQFVRVEAEFNPISGVVTWRLWSMDPETGEIPTDAYAGFLPPEDGTGRGQGHVTFSVRTRSDVPLGTRIANRAAIVFDTEAPIETNEVWNRVGGIPFRLGQKIRGSISSVADRDGYVCWIPEGASVKLKVNPRSKNGRAPSLEVRSPSGAIAATTPGMRRKETLEFDAPSSGLYVLLIAPGDARGVGKYQVRTSIKLEFSKITLTGDLSEGGTDLHPVDGLALLAGTRIKTRVQGHGKGAERLDPMVEVKGPMGGSLGQGGKVKATCPGDGPVVLAVSASPDSAATSGTYTLTLKLQLRKESGLVREVD